MDNLEITVTKDDHIKDILDIIDSMFEKEGISADENIKR